MAESCRICEEKAEAFCDCKAELTYLCKGCVGVHWSTPGRHLVTSLDVMPEANSSSLSSALDRRKKITLVKSFLSERLKQIHREHREYSIRLENMEKSLHDSLFNKFKELHNLLDLHVEKLVSEALSLQKDIQDYHEGSDKVTPLCESLLNLTQALNGHLAEPIGTLLTNCGGVETQISNLQCFHCQGLSVLIGGAAASTLLYYFSDMEESFVAFDPEMKTPTSKYLQYEGIVSFDSSWCTLQSGDVFVCGGTGNMEKLPCASILRVTTTELEPCSDLLVARSSHGVVQFKDDLFVFGGEGDIGCALASTECYTMANDSWTAKTALDQSITKVNTAVYDDVIYISGYNTYKLFVYFPSKDSYRPISFSFDRSFLSSCLLNISKDKTGRLLILRGSSVLFCEPTSDYDLRVVQNSAQTSDIAVWEIKGSVAQRENCYYVYNFHSKSVFEVFVGGMRVDVEEVMKEE